MEIKQISYDNSYIDSREVAEMIGKGHKNLLQDIRRYCKQMEQSNEEIQKEENKAEVGGLKIQLSEFFQETTYKTEQGKELPCYLLSKKGCEFIAHKLTGTKGTAFTARYINRFHDMERILKQSMQEIEEVAEAQTRLKKKSSWLADMEENFKFLCEAYNFSRKTLYHHILVDVGKVYDIDEAKAVYAKEKGYEPWYIMDVVEYFPQLRQEAEKTILAHIEKVEKKKKEKKGLKKS